MRYCLRKMSDDIIHGDSSISACPTRCLCIRTWVWPFLPPVGRRHVCMISAMHAFFPLVRRSWLCRACLRSQRQAIRPHRTAFAQQRATTAGRAVGSAPSTSTADVATRALNDSRKNSTRRRRLLVAGGGLAFSAGVVSVTLHDDAKHAYVAAQRSYRVLTTLVLNIHEYVVDGSTPRSA